MLGPKSLGFERAPTPLQILLLQIYGSHRFETFISALVSLIFTGVTLVASGWLE